MKFDVVIIGAGPGGLHCGKILAASGARVLILERKKTIGKKVCAGGITWGGLIERIPEKLIERSFDKQTVSTQFQNIQIKSSHPIIATVNRQKLGDFMAEKAMKYGAEIISPAYVTVINDNSIIFFTGKKRVKVSFDYLVGADGSQSKVRRLVGLANRKTGIGINYTLPCSVEKMEWNFNSGQFGSGYSWIFPHSETVSVGVYSSSNKIKSSELNRKVTKWGLQKGFDMRETSLQAEKICHDYQGWNFGRLFLIGDAAGLASPLTGEGIFPAFISAEATAKTILEKNNYHEPMEDLIKKHRKHTIMVKLADKCNLNAFILSELSAFLLRFGILSFKKFEMG